ncbi:MAG: glucose-1-phosphate thymidylyltransferase [Candidatus Aenigmarchaeota archaeon]|nr:glucose-1-phosphate thymidylyltransferase [Candidatus Aenigmarchaeota archaeon]
MKGLILAGGTGSRLRPLTYTENKHLIPIANKPILFYVIDELRKAGITEIGIILGNNSPDDVKAALRDGSALGVRITYIFQGEPKGIAHAVHCAKDFVGSDSFVVYLGDNLLKNGIVEIVQDFINKDCDASISLCAVPNPHMFGVAELDGSGKAVRLVEKPKEPKSNLALIGVYLLKPSIFPVIENLEPSWRNELEITDALQKLIEGGHKVDTHVVKGWWKDTGKPEDILEANHLVLDDLKPFNHGTVEDGSMIRGRVGIDSGTKIGPGVVIKGPVMIGKNCEITGKTYIGPYTSIGDNTVIDGAEIEDSIVIGNSRIACQRRIVDSLIGRNCSITSNAAIPSGHKFIIGENSIVQI